MDIISSFFVVMAYFWVCLAIAMGIGTITYHAVLTFQSIIGRMVRNSKMVRNLECEAFNRGFELGQMITEMENHD